MKNAQNHANETDISIRMWTPNSKHSASDEIVLHEQKCSKSIKIPIKFKNPQIRSNFYFTPQRLSLKTQIKLPIVSPSFLCKNKYFTPITSQFSTPTEVKENFRKTSVSGYFSTLSSSSQFTKTKFQTVKKIPLMYKKFVFKGF